MGGARWNVAQQGPKVLISPESKANRPGPVAAALQLCRENSDLLRTAIRALPPAKCKGLAIRLAGGAEESWQAPRAVLRDPLAALCSCTRPAASPLRKDPRQICTEHLDLKLEAAASAVPPTRAPGRGRWGGGAVLR